MSNIKGGKRRRVERIEYRGKYMTQAWLDCGHFVTRLNHLGVGQVVYCGECGHG